MRAIVWILALLVMGCGQHDGTPEVRLGKITREIAAEFPLVPTLAPAELAAWLDDPDREPPILLDVREPNEFAVSHLPGARRVDPDADVIKLLASLTPKRPVVLYCSVGFRSSKLAEQLLEAGASDVRNLEGSIFRWANEGLPLQRDGMPAHRVHPYSSRYAEMLHPNLRSEP
jgi:rhodanese-related sulfurtransferase